MDQRKKGLKPSPFRKGSKSHIDNNYNKQGTYISIGVKGSNTSNGVGNNTLKEVKCQGCNGKHLYRNCPHNPNRKMPPMNMLQEVSMVNDLARNIPKINATLEDRKVDHQSTMLEVEGKILNTFVSVLIDSGAS